MTPLLHRTSALAPLLAAVGLAACLFQVPGSPFLNRASAQEATSAPASPVAPAQPDQAVPDAAPFAPDAKLATEMVENRAEAPRFAPPGTFYLLKYVSVRTENGAEGLLPGQEVKLVEVHRDPQVLVVTNGRVQVEVPPGDLTNDRTVAAMAKANDQANQAQIVNYQQAQQAAYNRYQQGLADRAAQEKREQLEARKELAEAQRDAAKERKEEQQASRNAEAPAVNNGNPGYGYYGNGGDGYGSPFAYFAGAAAANAVNTANQPATAAPAAAAPAHPNNVARPAPAAPAAPAIVPRR